MSMFLLSVDIRQERRIRCVFSAAVDISGFNVAHFTVESLDGRSASPEVVQALMVASDPKVVELVLGSPLAKGGYYQVTVTGVSNVTEELITPGSSEKVRYGLNAPKSNVDPVQRDRERLLYGTDLLWDGVDYLESPTGDLEVVSGPAAVNKDLRRRADSNGLRWDDTYGVRLREFVDAPSTAAGTLRGRMNQQFLQDPRVKTVAITYSIDDENTYLNADVKLRSGEAVEPVTLVVPNG